MPKKYPAIYADKSSIVKSMFVSTADDNYALARLCFHRNLNVDFFWLAVHCLEKYFKAALLINGKTSRRFGHEIDKLYAEVHLLAPKLLITQFEKPGNMPKELWRNELVVDFIRRLHHDGQADNRYQLFGYVRALRICSNWTSLCSRPGDSRSRSKFGI
jgi:hypothetical protein